MDSLLVHELLALLFGVVAAGLTEKAPLEDRYKQGAQIAIYGITLAVMARIAGWL